MNWIPAVLAMAMIAAESTPTMSTNNTSGWLRPLWVWLCGPISDSHWYIVHHLIRKTGHLIGYGVVSLGFFHGWRTSFQGAQPGNWLVWRRAAVLAVFCTLAVACADEYHQSFLPSRTSSPIDVVIDLCGAILAQLVTLAILRLRSRRAELRAVNVTMV